MRWIPCLVLIVFSPPDVSAAPEKLYFVGEVKLSTGEGKPIGSQVILLEKTHDRADSRITERAIVVKPGGEVEDRTMRLTVAGDGSFSLVDTAGTVKGAGKLFGPPWKWTHFVATYRHESGVTIEDENFMTDESVITARKRVSGPDGKVLMYMEMSLKGITPATFEILAAGLTRK